MADLVVDASVAGAWFIEDEASELADAALDIAASRGALVSGLWPYEMANLLAIAERRGRATADQVSTALEFLSALPVKVALPNGLGGLGALTVLAREHRLTAYDASYLELAMRTSADLATHDAALRQAAKRVGVPLFSA